MRRLQKDSFLLGIVALLAAAVPAAPRLSSTREGEASGIYIALHSVLTAFPFVMHYFAYKNVGPLGGNQFAREYHGYYKLPYVHFVVVGRNNVVVVVSGAVDLLIRS